MSNFSTFYAQATKDKIKKVKKGKYKGQARSVKNKDLTLPGPAFYPNPGKTDAPSSSTYMVRG